MAVIHLVLAIVIAMLAGTLFGIRYIVLMERRMARIDQHIEGLVKKVLDEEEEIEEMLED